MAVSEKPRKQAAAIMLTVNDRDKAVSLGTLDPNHWDAEKALRISEALLPLLANSFSWIRHNPTFELVEDA